MNANNQFIIDWYLSDDEFLKRYSQSEVSQIRRTLLIAAKHFEQEQIVIEIVAFASAEFVKLKPFQTSLEILVKFIQGKIEQKLH